MRHPKNVAASVWTRLKNLAKGTSLPAADLDMTADRL